MVKTDLFEDFEFCDEPVVVLSGKSVYINGVEIKLGEYIVDDIKTVQFKLDRVMEILFRPETVIVFIPEECDVGTAYIIKYRDWIEVVFDGEEFCRSAIVAVIAHSDNEEHKLVFNSKFPVPKKLEDALSDCAERGIYISKGYAI